MAPSGGGRVVRCRYSTCAATPEIIQDDRQGSLKEHCCCESPFISNANESNSSNSNLLATGGRQQVCRTSGQRLRTTATTSSTTGDTDLDLRHSVSPTKQPLSFVSNKQIRFPPTNKVRCKSHNRLHSNGQLLTWSRNIARCCSWNSLDHSGNNRTTAVSIDAACNESLQSQSSGHNTAAVHFNHRPQVSRCQASCCCCVADTNSENPIRRLRSTNVMAASNSSILTAAMLWHHNWRRRRRRRWRRLRCRKRCCNSNSNSSITMIDYAVESDKSGASNAISSLCGRQRLQRPLSRPPRSPSIQTALPQTLPLPTLASALPLKSSQLILLAAVLLAVGVVAQAHSPREPAKLELWRRLLEPTLQEMGVAPSGVERLAQRLTKWPDQRKAALFYLDLLARRSSRLSSSAGTSGGGGGSSGSCRRVALAELEASSSSSSSGSQMWSTHWTALKADGEPESREQLVSFVKAHELSNAPFSTSNEVDNEDNSSIGGRTQEQLNQAAKLALENANLISRLLIYPESNVMRQLASPGFLKYLLESKVQQQQQPLTALHSLGLAFFSSNSATRTGLPTLPDCSFAPLALAPRWSKTGKTLLVDLAKLSLERTSNAYFALPATSSPSSGTNLQPFVAKWLLSDWSSELEPLATKVFSGGSETTTTTTKRAALELSDGRWFSPYFDCALSERWLLTYSVPFFGFDGSVATDEQQQQQQQTSSEHTNRLEAIKFRGVAFVSLELSRTGLVDQCSAEANNNNNNNASKLAFLANTHQCARLGRSQCVRLDNFREIRSGAYLCQCPAGSRPTAGELRATDERRDALTEQVANMAQVNVSHSLDQLPLELADERLTDRSQLLELFQVHNRSSQSYFESGAQLEVDAALSWLSGPDEDEDIGADVKGYADDIDSESEALRLSSRWPSMSCEPCQPSTKQLITAANSNGPSTDCQVQDVPGLQQRVASSSTSSSAASQLQLNANWQRAGSSSQLTWIRPLIVAVQTICALLALALVALMLRIRKSRIILVSGWLMLETTLLGALILYSSVFLHHFRATSITCLLEPWLRELGFSILYGSILIKLYRILTEFQTRKAHRVCFRDKDQIVYLLAIVLIVIGYMSAWTALMVDGFLFSSTSHTTSASNSMAAEGDYFQSLTNDQFKATSPASTSDFSRPISAATDSNSQWTSQLSGLANKLNSFGELFSGLLEVTSTSGDFQVGNGDDNHRSHQVMLDQRDAFLSAQLLSSVETSTTSQSLASEQSWSSSLSISASTTMRCRKLTWDYVTELSEMGLLLFGLYLVYKLRNASSEVYKEKVVLSASLLIELTVSTLTYTIRHAFWSRLSSDQLLILYFVRCQLTVTPTLLLVFGPKIWTIGKTRPGFLAAAIGVATNRTPSSGGSMRHRCHISCELHEHHLNDAMRLHQAMLSNSALDIGTINLADMDPDEIQTELKRVYAQLEVLKTKVMRRDNPHISKRRGGRKTGHRKFSLQAFHVRHIGGGGGGSHAHSSHSHQSEAPANTAAATDGSTASNTASPQPPPPLSSQHQRLTVPGELAKQEQLASSQTPSSTPRRISSGNAGERRVRLEGDDEMPTAHKEADQRHQHVRNSTNNNSSSHQHHNHHHRHHHSRANTNKQQHLKGSNTTQKQPDRAFSSTTNIQADPVSSSSATAYVCFDDDTLILNDSQSSGNASPQRQSSFICSHSSIQREDSSLN